MEQKASTTGRLYLIPTPLLPGAVQTLPPHSVQIMHTTYYYIAENARSARRLIKASDPPFALNAVHVSELDKHNAQDIGGMLAPAFAGHHIGLLSEAGCPGVADPGSAVVLRAHAIGVKVVPLIGPSSVVLALMASGLNGQQFQFHGYLSPKKEHLSTDLRRLEDASRKDQITQIFIETPYRNRQVTDTAFKVLSPSTLFCIAADLTGENEFILTMTIAEWRRYNLPELHKRPAVFCLMGS